MKPQQGLELDPWANCVNITWEHTINIAFLVTLLNYYESETLWLELMIQQHDSASPPQDANIR